MVPRLPSVGGQGPTLEAGEWISLGPNYVVTSPPDLTEIEIVYTSQRWTRLGTVSALDGLARNGLSEINAVMLRQQGAEGVLIVARMLRHRSSPDRPRGAWYG
jgi:hypothetical protein